MRGSLPRSESLENQRPVAEVPSLWKGGHLSICRIRDHLVQALCPSDGENQVQGKELPHPAQATEPEDPRGDLLLPRPRSFSAPTPHVRELPKPSAQRLGEVGQLRTGAPLASTAPPTLSPAVLVYGGCEGRPGQGRLRRRPHGPRIIIQGQRVPFTP